MLQKTARAPRTVKIYATGWEVFVAWCRDAGRDSLPASADTVSLFFASEIHRGMRLKTCRLRLSCIAHAHREAGYPAPIDDTVRSVVSGAARALRERPGGKAALEPDVLRRACDAITRSRSFCGTRDKAVLLLGFAAGWRRSELAALQVCDVRFVKQGLRLYQSASKTDQEGCGRPVGIPFGTAEGTCPVRAVRAWVEQRGNATGYLFVRSAGKSWTSDPMDPESISQLVKRRLRAVGEDDRRYGAHSLRAGCVTAAAEAGADLPAIMQRTGHKSVAVVMGYIRPGVVFRNDPLAGVL